MTRRRQPKRPVESPLSRLPPPRPPRPPKMPKNHANPFFGAPLKRLRLEAQRAIAAAPAPPGTVVWVRMRGTSEVD